MTCPKCHKDHEPDVLCRLIDLTRAGVGVDLAEVPLLFLDVETTGFSPARDRIVEISLVKMRGGEIIGSFETLIDPERPIPAAATAVHGIDMFSVMSRPPFAAHRDTMDWFLDDHQAVIVGHNVAFDLGFLNAELARAGRVQDQWSGLSFCTLLLARRVYKFSNNKLASLALKLGIEVEQSHRAGKDVQATIGVFNVICERIRPKEASLTVRHVLQAQGGYQPAPVFR